jgi:hypothetical protein
MRFKEFKLNLLTEAILDEVSMSPTSLQRWADSPDAEGMLMGIEFEMVIPNLSLMDYDSTDYDYDRDIDNIQDIVGWFQDEYRIPVGGVPLSEWLRREYNEWKEEFSDDDSDLNEKDWLEDSDVFSLRDAAEIWDLEWPSKPKDSKEGITIDDVSRSFQKALGLTKVHTSSSYHGATREDSVWSIETDSSIEGLHGDNGLEFISPAQPIAKTLEQMKQLVKWAKSEECYTNDSTGLHINISVPNFSIEKLDFIKLALFMGDKYILDQFKRTSNNYCRSATDIIKRKVTPENAEAVLAKMREHLNIAASKLIHSGTTDKYTSINTQDGYVEFRGPGGNYLDKPVEQLVNTSLRLAIALQIACDENAHKEEYSKKLYKLIAPADSNNDTVKLFSMYAAGELHRNLLMYSVRQIQKIRKGIVPGQINIPLFDIFKPEYAQYLDMKGDWQISYPNGDIGHRFDVTPRMLAHAAGSLPEGTSIQITLKGQDQPQVPNQSATITTPAPRAEAVSGDTADPLWKIYRDGYPQNYTLRHSPTAQAALAWASARTDMPKSNFQVRLA